MANLIKFRGSKKLKNQKN